jgi:hypothetical protein
MGLVPPSAVKLLGLLSDANLPHRATVERLAETGDGAAAGGVRVRSWAIVTTAAPCCVAPYTNENATAAAIAAAGQFFTAGRWSVRFRARADVEAGDRLQVSGTVDGTAWTATLYVVGVWDALEQEAFRRVLCSDTPTVPAP